MNVRAKPINLEINPASVSENTDTILPVESAINTDTFKQLLSDHLTNFVGKDHITATRRDWFYAAAYVVRSRLIDRRIETKRNYQSQDAKRIYYFSMEFLMGRTLMNSLHNLSTVYNDQESWIKKAILNVANMGHISSDRTIMQYADEIWGAVPYSPAT